MVLNAASLILSPSWKSIARLTLPSRLELKSSLDPSSKRESSNHDVLSAVLQCNFKPALSPVLTQDVHNDSDHHARHRRQDDQHLSRDRDWRSDCRRKYSSVTYFANIRDIVGGRSAAYEQELARARTDRACDELKMAAQQLGADAVVQGRPRLRSARYTEQRAC